MSFELWEIGCLLFIFSAAGVMYVAWIRPKLQERRAIKENREWTMKFVDSALAEIESRNRNNQIRPTDNVTVITDIREHWGFPPKQQQIIEGIYSQMKNGGPWDFAVHIHEASEQYLGSTQFRRLEKRFGEIIGVDECVQDDREVFLVKTRTLNAKCLRKAIWQQILEAADPKNATGNSGDSIFN